ncbi:MAG: hypothetical protein WBD28_07420, partial [Candidatus Zixiibacteriota bacterium]
ISTCYSLSGRSKKAISLLTMKNEIDERMGNKQGIAAGLINLAINEVLIGDLNAADNNVRLMINLTKEANDELWESVGHRELGGLLAFQGRFEESEKELGVAINVQQRKQRFQSEGVSWAYSAIRGLLVFDRAEVLQAAKKARELANSEHSERDIIRAEWLLGAAYLAKGDFTEAEKHLYEALRRDRRINLVELEPDILLELAKLRFKQGHSAIGRSASGGKKEALKLANEALQIADRYEYRLKQADIHNFLAEFYLDKKDYKTAKKHADIAKERSECGYKPALDKAIKLSKLIAEKSKS